jgi:hypothetical protein
MNNVMLRCIYVTTVAVGKHLSITQLECASVALGIQHALCMHNLCIICGLAHLEIILHIILQMAQFFKKKVIGHKMRVLISSTIFVQNISHSKKK